MRPLFDYLFFADKLSDAQVLPWRVHFLREGVRLVMPYIRPIQTESFRPVLRTIPTCECGLLQNGFGNNFSNYHHKKVLKKTCDILKIHGMIKLTPRAFHVEFIIYFWNIFEEIFYLFILLRVQRINKLV